MVYDVQNFIVHTSRMRFKTCEHKYIMKANNDTVISFSDQDDSIFPKNMFQFKDFGSLKAPGGVDCNQLIDLIGRVVSIHQPKDIQVKQNSQRLIDFVIEDCRESRLTVTLWDEHVDSVLPFLNGALTDPLIVILQLCRARVTDDGEIRISSSYTATRVLFNYECPELFAFKDSLLRFLTPIQTISSRSRNMGSRSLETMSNENMTVTSLMDIYDDKNIGEFWVVGEITDIQRDWYFIACANKGCGKKIQEINDQMYCKSCDQQSPDEIIKYKLVIDVLDDEQDGQLILWDNVCSPLLGITASELKGKYSEEGVQADEAISNSFKKGEQGNVIRKLAEEKEFNENFGQGIESLEVIPSSNLEVIILDESTPDQQSLKRTNMDCSSSSKTLKKPKNEPNPC
ncbi:uncharacterized protein LOC115996004 [Ipomoea triloba]|uniref:uncharacterized protein LOC115996004 n=1 Tax=Ipomoea triloba TaxID=35885 RepID=UPI00125D806F|nr:uncharacterized protein LOC115996004 [Ipomoea triloba]